MKQDKDKTTADYEKALLNACKAMLKLTGSCPVKYDKFHPPYDCNDHCKDGCEVDCWKTYFLNKKP